MGGWSPPGVRPPLLPLGLVTVYSRRLSDPQTVDAPSGTHIHVTVPAGRVYVITHLFLTNEGTTAGQCRFVLLASGVSTPFLRSAMLAGGSSAVLEVMLPLVAAEQLLAYRLEDPVNMVLTVTGWDLTAP